MLYVIGDDSPFMLVCKDDNYTGFSQIQLLNRSEKRIPKPEKPDFEASLITTDKKLLIIGSASTGKRELMMLFPFAGGSGIVTISSSDFFNRVKATGIDEVNVESAALLTKAGKVILSLRGNQVNRRNRFIITEPDFYLRQQEVGIAFSEIILPETKFYCGISDFAYLPDTDTLFFTASTEETNNAYDDGTIGDSYIGWIENVSGIMDKPVRPTAYCNLTELDTRFYKQKIEGICVRSMKDKQVQLILVTDNDEGESSKLYEMSMNYP